MKFALKDKLEGHELDLSLNELTEVPVKDLAALPKATHLDLSCNKLMALPISFSSTLTFLIRLDLSKNLLTDLPHNFGGLKLLQYLDLYGNQLRMMPVSFSQLKNLKWLDLKNNPMEPGLKSVAGDCLDEKQCQLCAKKVVAYMQNVELEVEKEKQKRVKEEKDKARARRFQEEQELKRQKELKKAEKEKRKAEQKQKYIEKRTQISQDEEKSHFNGNGNSVNLKQEPNEIKKNKSGSLFRLLFVLFLFSPIILLITNITLKWLNGHPIRSTDDLKSLATTEFALLRKHTELAYHLTLTKGHQMWRVVSGEITHFNGHLEEIWSLTLKKGAELQEVLMANAKRLWSKWNSSG